VDAGAHVGTFAIRIAKAVVDGTVIAIEPDKENLNYLEKNVKLNSIKNVVVVQKGLWSKSGRMLFYLTHSASHSMFAQKGVKKAAQIEVDTLDNILERVGMDKVNFIKINVEGTEIEVLKGARKTLMSNPVEIVIDAHHTVDGRPTYETVIPMLRELGFVCTGKSLIHAFPKQ
jgi:FkbM family methyltransferase